MSRQSSTVEAHLGERLTVWHTVPCLPPVTQDIQVWRIACAEYASHTNSLLRLLTDEERHRAARTRVDEARTHFIVGRAVLRILLGNALGIAASMVILSVGPHGKLELSRKSGLFFNLAHSRGLIVIAFTRSGPVGIDVEAVDDTVDIMEVAETAFAPGEIVHLQSLSSSDERRLAFFRYWTRKEAVVKADGCGLILSLDVIQVPASTYVGGDVRLPAHACGSDAIFCVGDIFLRDPYIGAIAGVPCGQMLEGYCMSSATLRRLLLH